MKYAIDKNFSNEFDNWNKSNFRKVFVVGTTSEVLTSLGIKGEKIKWDGSKIIKIMSKHSEMTSDVIKQVPNILENPIIVMKSKTNDNRITMFGEVYANNKPVLAVLELSPNNTFGLSLDEIKIASAYGKNNAQKFIDTSKILYIDKNNERVSTFETRTGLQLPVGGADSTYSIPNSSENVNIKYSVPESDNVKHSIGLPLQNLRYNTERFADSLFRRYGSGAEKFNGKLTIYFSFTDILYKKGKVGGMMNFRYKLMRFISGRYGVDTLFYFIFAVATALSILNCFLRIIYLQIAVYLLVIIALMRMFSRNIAARTKENRIFSQTAEKIRKYSETKHTRRADFTHIYKRCPNCGATLRLPRKKGKHKTVCPKCEHEFSVRVFKEYKPL